MNKTYYSGDFYLTIADEPPITNSGEVFCMFDLTRYKGSFWGVPVNQCGTAQEVLYTLKAWVKISKKPDMERKFIAILENEIKRQASGGEGAGAGENACKCLDPMIL